LFGWPGVGLAWPGVGLAGDCVVEAITRPSKDVVITFVRPGQIAKMPVKIGQRVKVGEVLAELEDSAERIQLAQLKAKADDVTLIRARQASLDQAQVELKMTRDAFKTGAATELEVRRAELQVTMARAELDLAKFQRKVTQLQHKEAQAQLARMKLISPTDGVVEVIMIDAGESVDAQNKGVMRLVNIDPLWVDVPVPLVQARKLWLGELAVVDFGFGQKETREGQVVHIASVADPASETLWVRIEVANPSGRPSGESVRVRFREKTISQAKAIEKNKKPKPDKTTRPPTTGAKEKK